MIMYIDTKGEITLTFQVNVTYNGYSYVVADNAGYFVGYLPEHITDKDLKTPGFSFETEYLTLRT